MKTLIIDNYDSFTYNLFQLFGFVTGEEPVVVLNDDLDFTLDDLSNFDAVVLSPGPGRPERFSDFGHCREILDCGQIPLLGVCLGHQGLCHANGGKIDLAPSPMHGRLSSVFHDRNELFKDIPSPFQVVRYHSLVVSEIPLSLEVTARTNDGLVMAVRHKERPAWGVQFHPESISTEHSVQLAENFVSLARKSRDRKSSSNLLKSNNIQNMLGTQFKAQAPKSRKDYEVLCRELKVDVDSELVFDRLFKRSPHAFWLDSSLKIGERRGRFSFMGDASGPLARIVTADVHAGTVETQSGSGKSITKQQFFDWLEADMAGLDVDVPNLPFDFALGWVGYLGYELKSEVTGSTVHHSSEADAAMIFADRAVAFDHETNRVYILALSCPGSTASQQQFLDYAKEEISALSKKTKLGVPGALKLKSALKLRHSSSRYINLVNQCLEAIRQGESYELCLTNMVSARAAIDPFVAYRRLRSVSPAPFAAFLRFDDLSVLSSSPERFIRIGSDKLVESKPIKGTRPRSANKVEDDLHRNELASNEKDRAENLMIVDLVRNDLGSCSEIGSVHVPLLFEIEEYATVFQLVSTVRAKLLDSVSPIACVRRAFPGGSMTGAPKIRTMNILDRLEEGPRGIYSGAIGYFSLSNAVDLSIVIRTLVVSGDDIRFGVGGAIVALSDPEEEFEETAVKANGLLRVFKDVEFPERYPMQKPQELHVHQ